MLCDRVPEIYEWQKVDTSRHYLPLSFLEHLLDACEMNKFNFFHVHLVDAQSFPLVLPSAPELADGAWGGASSPLTYGS
jgi:hexosaminidase